MSDVPGTCICTLHNVPAMGCMTCDGSGHQPRLPVETLALRRQQVRLTSRSQGACGVDTAASQLIQPGSLGPGIPEAKLFAVACPHHPLACMKSLTARQMLGQDKVKEVGFAADACRASECNVLKPAPNRSLLQCCFSGNKNIPFCGVAQPISLQRPRALEEQERLVSTHWAAMKI